MRYECRAYTVSLDSRTKVRQRLDVKELSHALTCITSCGISVYTGPGIENAGQYFQFWASF